MDLRWGQAGTDTKRDVRVILHPSASVSETRRGAQDGVDITALVSQGSHTCFDCNLTLHWNYELFGPTHQPRPAQVLEIQLPQNNLWQPVWIGIIDAVSSYTLARGERSLQLTARTQDSLDIFRTTKRVTSLYPMMTDITYIARAIAKQCGLAEDEILLPVSAFTTPHSNTQLSDQSAWEMFEILFMPVGWKPWIDGLGRLRAASRELQGRTADVVLTPERIVKVKAQRVKSPITRYTLKWRNPQLKKSLKQGQLLGTAELTTGWFLPYVKKTIYFSDDETQRAEKTYMKTKQSANLWVRVCRERYTQLDENKGRIKLTNYMWGPTIGLIALQWFLAHNIPDTVQVGPSGTGQTVSVGRKIEAASQLALMLIMLSIGTGVYEIWGNPYDYVHAQNTTVAFDDSSPLWVDVPMEGECDFIFSEEHAKAVSVRELIWGVRSANKWTVSLVEDARIEFGDILEFPDGGKMYVEDIKRSLERGSENQIEVTGFLIGGNTPATYTPPAVGDPLAGTGGPDQGGPNQDEPQQPVA